VCHYEIPFQKTFMQRIEVFWNQNRIFESINLIHMLIERTSTEVIIRLPSDVDTVGLQRLVDYLSYKESTSNSKAKQTEVDKLAKEVKKGWWSKNRSRFIK
jgi:hypothetical protein